VDKERIPDTIFFCYSKSQMQKKNKKGGELKVEEYIPT
jgi:hypothetical protein